MQPFIIAYASLVGLAIGSAINAVVWRLYVGKKWTRGRSMCPDCRHELRARDLVPVLSWLFLRGKCRYCRKGIHWQYPLVEVITALLFGLSAAALPASGVLSFIGLALWLAALTLLVVMAVYDARWMLLPNKVMLPTAVVALALLGFNAVATGSVKVLLGGLVAAAIAGGAFFALVYFSKGRAMGEGDIKLAAVMGLLLGAQGTAVAMMVGFYAAALFGVGVLVRRRRLRGVAIPFGPFLIAGTVVGYLYGRDVFAWYLRLNGLA